MGSFLVILSAFGFSTLAVLGKIAYDAGFTRNQALVWRFGLALPFLWVILWKANALPKITSSEPAQSRKHELRKFSLAILLGMVGIGMEATLYFMTLETIGAALTGVFLYLYPAFVALISHFFLGEKLSLLKWGCVALSLVGCIFTVDLSSTQVKSQIGVVYGILTAVWYAIYLLTGNRLVKGHHPLTVSGGIVLGAFISFAGLAWMETQTRGVIWVWPHTGNAWIAIMGLAVLASVIPFTTLYVGMKKVGATKASVLSTLEMGFTILLAAWILGEKMTVSQIFGAVIILVSVVLIQFVDRKKDHSTSTV